MSLGQNPLENKWTFKCMVGDSYKSCVCVCVCDFGSPNPRISFFFFKNEIFILSSPTFLATTHGIWGLSSLTRGGTLTPYSGSTVLTTGPLEKTPPPPAPPHPAHASF